MQINPQEGKEVQVDVEGYGCEDDCREFFPRVKGEDCGWKKTDNTCPLW